MPANSDISRAVVVGFGRMGRIHARALDALGYRVETVDPVAPDADHADIMAVAPQGIAAVAVAVPIPLLHATAMHALEWLAPRALLVEKPGGMDAVDIERTATLAALKGCRIAIGYTERHNPAAVALADDLAARRRAPVRAMVAARYSPHAAHEPAVPHALDMAVHDIDLWRRLAPGASFGWQGGYAPHAMRVITCLHADGGTSVLDMARHMLDGRVYELPGDAVTREWRALLADDYNGGNMRHEADVVLRARGMVRDD